ncbi:hypothetical protein J8I26_08840 [Herbaspirillum sp. LeCh32-8]|uniref:hypothetical protein n=1 Tax=Herbaspirillum sp. LeCh32-8 TaxID=2821356 RepID=UPI001AE4F15C|nr:hypothetical protein [Herbaspirillum sp. LeCh32-8]MBP0598206.1 hypothetical protein [Herbaspirillum sp. LeCh32-8]
MSKVLSVSLYADRAHIEVQVEARKGGHFALTLSVNGKDMIGPMDGFATPHEALDYALVHYTGYPLTGVYVEGGKGALDAGVANDFIQSLESKGLRAFHKFLQQLEAQYGIAPALEGEYRTAHTRWVSKGSLFDAAVAINKLRNSPRR